jgi:hypothetical protein
VSGDEITEVKVALARIETKLEAHFSRDDERAKRWDDHEDRISALEAEDNKRKGGKAALVGLLTAASAAGGMLVKFWPWGAR